MKLHEIVLQEGKYNKQVTISPADGLYGKVKLDVEFNFSEGGSSRHGDNASFDETHDDELEVRNVKLAQDVEEMDSDGKNVVKVWKKGTDADKLPEWSEADDELVIDALHKLRG